MRRKIQFKIPDDFKPTTQKDVNDNKVEKEASQAFQNFSAPHQDSSRKKVLLVIAGSKMRDDNDSQYYPNYLKKMAKENPNHDFLVLNVDNSFLATETDKSVEESNVKLHLLKGELNPLTSPDFYTKIGDNLQHFDKVVFCSHISKCGHLYFDPLHKHCQKQEIDCITIGAYEEQSPCCIIKDPKLIKEDFIPLSFFQNKQYIDDNLTEIQDLQTQINTGISAIFGLLSKTFGTNEKKEKKQEFIEEKKESKPEFVDFYTGIEDPNFQKAVNRFVKKPPFTKEDKETVSRIIGVGVGAVVGLTCVSALGLGIVSAPAIAIVAGTVLVGATAFSLINEKNQNNNFSRK